MSTTPKHPIQPLVPDLEGTLRFKQNAIVRFLLDGGRHNMNDLAVMNFSDEDREQFAQLIGYSLRGYGELSYVSDASYETASIMSQSGVSEEQARIEHLESVLGTVRAGLKIAAPAVFKIHPDDLTS